MNALQNPTKWQTPYRAYEALVAPARPSAQYWRLLVGVVAITFLFLFGMRLYISLVAGLLSLPVRVVNAALLSATQPEWTLVILFSFLVLAIATMAVTRLLHARPVRSLIGAPSQALRNFLLVAGAILLLQLLLSILPPWGGSNLLNNPEMPLSRWLLLLPLSLSGVLIQTGSEELLFRGYLQSQLAARLRSPVIWIGLPSAIFAALHYDPATNGSNVLWVVAWAAGFGVLSADLTARTGNLGAAIGFHFANNIFALLIVGFAGNLGGLALYHLPYSAADFAHAGPSFLIDFATMFTAWLAARLVLRV
ncbi:MAG: lysostaphin resistance A-like protein [Halocynthiibacter sp.]